MISGAFSLARQAVQLGYLPRLEVRHTSEHQIGQVYLPRVNWGLMVAVGLVVIGFGSSSRLAAAYGIAVLGTMIITVVLAFVVAVTIWRWHPSIAALPFALFLTVDLGIFSSTALKIPAGSWLPGSSLSCRPGARVAKPCSSGCTAAPLRYRHFSPA